MGRNICYLFIFQVIVLFYVLWTCNTLNLSFKNNMRVAVATDLVAMRVLGQFPSLVKTGKQNKNLHTAKLLP